MTAPTLMIVDMQKAIDDPFWGRRGQPDVERNIAALLANWRERDGEILHVRHDSTNPASPYAPDRSGNAFKAECAPQNGETIVAKRTNNAFVDTNLMEQLEDLGTQELIICGVLLENSVAATVRMAANVGFHVHLPPDCVASTDRTDRTGTKWTAEDVHALWLSILERPSINLTSASQLMERA